MVDAIVTVALEVAKCLFPPIGRQLSYVRKYKANLENLKKETEKLTVARDSMQKKVEDARRNGEEIDKRVESWLISVDKIVAEADTLIGEEENANKKCVKGLCPNMKKRYQRSEKAATKEKSIAELKEEAEKLDQISYPTVPEEPWLRSGKGYEAFESRMSTLKNVQNALLDPDVSITGVYGMGGLGKTTLVKEVARQVKKDKHFDEVVFAEVSETPDIRKVQGELADQLGMKFDEESDVPGRARKLYARLQNENKILVILDNIWEDLDLEQVGVPSGNDCGGCKVLLTARDRHVLESTGSKTLGIDVLNDEEAWTLFKKMTGDCAEKGELKSLATEVAKECGGLPIAIVTLAKALRNKSSVSTWKDALRQLKRPSPWNFEGVLAKPYSAIELSYKYLREEELKQLFLQCSLMGSPKHSMLNLLKYAIGLGILKGVSTMDEARDKVNTLVDQLKDACLLLDGTDSGRFSMHDVVRDVAISVASRDYHAFSMRNEVDPRQWPDKDSLKKCSRISLYDNNISEIPQGWECPQLESFFIFAPKDSPLKIPDNIFIGMPQLKVLHLSKMRLLSLPSSIHLLTDLRTLCLHGCELEDIKVIGDLKKLEILSLQRSGIEQLPREIGQLSQLKLLDLRNCSKLKVIAPNVLSSLSQLEELYMANCVIEWEHLGLSIERSNASLVELKNLSRLSTLQINILDAGILPSGFFSRKLETYRIVVGNEWDRFDKYKTPRTLKLKLNSRICLEEWRGMKNVEYLCLGELQGLTNVLHDLDGEGFAELKHLNVENNSNFLCIVGAQQVSCGAFPMLESLVLRKLINLERICHGQLLEESFCNLKTIEVRGCDKLKNLFSFSIAKFLPQLETIEVIQCKNVEEIFVSSNEVVIDEIALRQVRFLILRTLPLFTSFSKYVETTATVEANHNEIIFENENQVYTPPSLFNEKLVLPNLEVLKVRDINVAKIWHNQLSAAMPCNVQNLTRLIVEDCRKLKHVFSYSTAKRLGQLQRLVISRCPLLEEIVGMEGGVEADPYFVFRWLTILQLSSLPELRAFYPGMHTLECLILTELKVSSCDKLESFSSEPSSLFNEKHVLPNLVVLELKGNNVAKIWHNQLSAAMSCNVQNLTRLAVRGCRRLKYVFSYSTAKRLGQLQHLEISNCPLLEEIVGEEGEVEADAYFVFPRLTILQLSLLPELRAFYPGMHTLEFPMLTELKVSSCGKLESFSSEPPSLFNEKLVLPKLEVLEVRYINVAKIWHNQLSEMACNAQNLTRLAVRGCRRLKYVFSYSTAKRLGQLQHLEISNCPLLEEIVGEEGGVEADAYFVFPKLTILQLSLLPELRAFYPGMHTLEFPMLTELKVSSCDKLESFSSEPPSLFNEKLVLPKLEVLEVRYTNVAKIWHNQLSEMACNAQNLTRLVMWACRKIKYVFSYSTAKRLGQLQHLEISNCPLLEEIVGEEGGVEADAYFVFPKLTILQLKVLPELRVFYPGMHTLEFPMLTELKVSSCGKLESFSSEPPSLFNEKLVLPKLEVLEVRYTNVAKIWHNQLSAAMSCNVQNLTRLAVQGCRRLKYVFSYSTAKRLGQLQHLEISNCPLLEEIVGEEGEVEADAYFVFPRLTKLQLSLLPELRVFYPGMHTLEFPMLTELKVSSCGKLESFSSEPPSLFNEKLVLPKLEVLEVRYTNVAKIWHNQLSEMACNAQNLTRLVVWACRKIKYVFSYSTAKRIVQLQHLEISNCPLLEEIVGEEGGVEADAYFIFPRLTILQLSSLPELRAFYPGIHTLECPVLTKLEVSLCDKLESFYSELHSLHENNEECQLIDVPMRAQQPLFLVEKVLSNLEELIIGSKKDITKIWQGQFPDRLLDKLKVLAIKSDQSEVLACDLLEKFHNLISLQLENSSYTQLFSNGGQVEKHVGKLAQIKSLKLKQLNDLKHLWLWEENSKLNTVFQNLETLSVFFCHNLTNLMPSSASFRCLRELTVWRCEHLINLAASSAAKNLVQLVKTTVKGCSKITELVVASEGDAADDGIIFPKLEVLTLSNLQSLTAFCSANYTFKFPSLYYLSMDGCPMMKIFCGGVLSTPRLEEVWHNFQRCWNGDLNSTVQLSCYKTNVQSLEEDSGQPSIQNPE